MGVELCVFSKTEEEPCIACIRELVLQQDIHGLPEDTNSIQQWICTHSRHVDGKDTLYYWICVNHTYVGIATLKRNLQEELYADSGHIGICIRKSMRRQGIGKEALKQAIGRIRRFGVQDILLCCRYDNFASRRLCESVQAVLKHEDSYCHYWISEDLEHITDL